jgi:CubicO group peptidase (beta-lactamase class C family)
MRSTLTLTSTLLLAALPALWSQPAPKAGERALQAWLEMFNSGDAAKARQFHQQWIGEGDMPLEDRVRRELEMRRQSGGFTLLKILDASELAAAALLRMNSSGQPFRVEIELDPAPPHRIVMIDLSPDEPAGPPPPRLTAAGFAAAVRQQLDELAAAGRFSGAVSVTRGGRELLSGAWGMADREKNIPNRPGTKFNLGSMNKMFTAVAIAQLAQAGKLRFDDPVGKHLKDYPNREVAEKVTIHHLLTHTGGVGDIFGPEFDRHMETLRDLKDYVALYGSRAPQFAPGSRWSYSNYGYILLGRIIEEVSGMSYYGYVREKIFLPAGMEGTASYWKTEEVPDLARGYIAEPGAGPRRNDSTLPMRGTSAGGGYSTAPDLQRFAAALLSHKLLDAAHTALLTTPHAKAGRRGAYGYGFMIEGEGPWRWFGHSGGAPGINSELRIFPETGYVVAVLSNLPPSAQRVTEWISQRLPEP